MKQNVFVYGTLKQGFGNHGILNRAKFVGIGTTVSGAFKMLDGGFPMVLTDGLFKVTGELYEVPDETTLKNLDRLEGVPTLFVRHPVEVEVQGETYDALMYVGAERYQHGSWNNYIIPNENNVVSWR